MCGPLTSTNPGRVIRVPDPTGLGHPSWCLRAYCTAETAGRVGAHRSRPVVVGPHSLTANLYADATEPNVVLVEVAGCYTLMHPCNAYGFGRVLAGLGRLADDRV
jgi:hypothetical protein